MSELLIEAAPYTVLAWVGLLLAGIAIERKFGGFACRGDRP